LALGFSWLTPLPDPPFSKDLLKPSEPQRTLREIIILVCENRFHNLLKVAPREKPGLKPADGAGPPKTKKQLPKAPFRRTLIDVLMTN
jgi:hypothetical protein